MLIVCQYIHAGPFMEKDMVSAIVSPWDHFWMQYLQTSWVDDHMLWDTASPSKCSYLTSAFTLVSDSLSGPPCNMTLVDNHILEEEHPQRQGPLRSLAIEFTHRRCDQLHWTQDSPDYEQFLRRCSFLLPWVVTSIRYRRTDGLVGV